MTNNTATGSASDSTEGGPPLFESNLSGLERIARGKVRDLYAADDEHLLIVTSDRLSAFDVILPDAIPSKGRVLTEISNFWFESTHSIVRNHLSGKSPEEFVTDPQERRQIAGRAVVVRRLRPLPIEAVVRGYLIGSGWNDYRATGEVSGIRLPRGLRVAERLPQPIFTPATKAAPGEHDENISFEQSAELLGADLAEQICDIAVALYEHAACHAITRGIIVADTKFEFGLDADEGVWLIDEAVTPDSSRLWPADAYAPGSRPPSLDKQFVRDYLEGLEWDKSPPAPHLPAEIIARTSERYCEIRRRLTAGD